ncbi:hypothetical protein B0H11DRAFT_2225094 [Mycena galericulata]|nr:hypothetical protein B0H11DRAFT_2225094 [Mycena galericulata]
MSEKKYIYLWICIANCIKLSMYQKDVFWFFLFSFSRRVNITVIHSPEQEETHPWRNNETVPVRDPKRKKCAAPEPNSDDDNTFVAHIVVYRGKLIEISYIDLAEQTLSFRGVWPIIRNCLAHSHQPLVELRASALSAWLIVPPRVGRESRDRRRHGPHLRRQPAVPSACAPLVAANTDTLLVHASAASLRTPVRHRALSLPLGHRLGELKYSISSTRRTGEQSVLSHASTVSFQPNFFIRLAAGDLRRAQFLAVHKPYTREHYSMEFEDEPFSSALYTPIRVCYGRAMLDAERVLDAVKWIPSTPAVRPLDTCGLRSGSMLSLGSLCLVRPLPHPRSPSRTRRASSRELSRPTLVVQAALLLRAHSAAGCQARWKVVVCAADLSLTPRARR